MTHGSVSTDQGTWAYIGPCGVGSFGIEIALGTPGFHGPQCFVINGKTCAGDTSPATISVVYCGRYQRSKNTFEYVLVRHVFDIFDKAHRGVL